MHTIDEEATNDRPCDRDTLPPGPSSDALIANATPHRRERSPEEVAFVHRLGSLVQAIEDAPGPLALPSVEALRELVATAKKGRAAASSRRAAIQYIGDCEIDPLLRLELLRDLLVDENGQPKVCGTAKARKELDKDPESHLARFRLAAQEGGRPAMDMLVAWLDDERPLDGPRAVLEVEYAVVDVAHCLLGVLANAEPDAVLDALQPLRSRHAMNVLIYIAAACPKAAVAFARRSYSEGRHAAAVMALLGVSENTPVPQREEVRELATTIASDAEAWISRHYAFKSLLRLPTVEPRVWAALRELPHNLRPQLPTAVGCWVRRGSLGALELLEHWMRESSEGADEACEGFSAALSGEDSSDVPDDDLLRRVVRDAVEARERGASDSHVGRVAEVALQDCTDARYAALGLDRLVSVAVAAGAYARRFMMYSVSQRDVRGTAWTARLLERIAEASSFPETLDHASQLARERSAPDAWTEAQIGRLLTSCRPGMSHASAASVCGRMIYGDKSREGERQIVAWFARQFPEDRRIRRALRVLEDSHASYRDMEDVRALEAAWLPS